jgi:hypothetical protein
MVLPSVSYMQRRVKVLVRRLFRCTVPVALRQAVTSAADAALSRAIMTLKAVYCRVQRLP